MTETPEEQVARIVVERAHAKKPPPEGTSMQKSAVKGAPTPKSMQSGSTTSTRQRARKVSTAERKALFITELTKRGIVTDAAIASGVSRSAPYVWHHDDAEFAAAWEDALEQAADALEAEAWRRAVEGTTKPVFQGGRHVGDIREYSDTLLVQMLKADRPTKFRERTSVEIANKPGEPFEVSVHETRERFTSLVTRLAERAAESRGDSEPQ